MKQIVQPVSGGPVTLLDVPRPVPEPTEVLVRTLCSVISPGTERAVTALAQSSLLAKARARPDLVRQVVGKARTEGLAATRQTVLGRLAQDVPLGYSAAGVVVEAGCAVTGVRPGQLVATGGAGQGESRGVPGRARTALRAGARRRQRPGRGVHHDRVHRLARTAHRGRGAWREGRGGGPRADRAARRAACHGGRMRRGGDRPGRLPARRSPRGPACWRSTSAAKRPRNRCLPGPAAGARTRCSSARPGRLRPP